MDQADVTQLDDAGSADAAQLDARFHALVRRLSEQSVRKNFDAYLDVPWDDHAIDSADPRWELRSDDTLGATDWYQRLPQAERARLELQRDLAAQQPLHRQQRLPADDLSDLLGRELLVTHHE